MARVAFSFCGLVNQFFDAETVIFMGGPDIILPTQWYCGIYIRRFDKYHVAHRRCT